MFTPPPGELAGIARTAGETLFAGGADGAPTFPGAAPGERQDSVGGSGTSARARFGGRALQRSFLRSTRK